MSQSQLQGVTPEHYTQLEGSHFCWYRVFQEEPGTNSWFLRLIFDSDCDTEITFGPMDAETVDSHASILLRVGYIHYEENWEGPRYESIIAQGAELPAGKEDANKNG